MSSDRQRRMLLANARLRLPERAFYVHCWMSEKCQIRRYGTAAKNGQTEGAAEALLKIISWGSVEKKQ